MAGIATRDLLQTPWTAGQPGSPVQAGSAVRAAKASVAPAAPVPAAPVPAARAQAAQAAQAAGASEPVAESRLSDLPADRTRCVLGQPQIDLSLTQTGGQLPGTVTLHLVARAKRDVDGVELMAIPGDGVTLLSGSAGTALFTGSMKRGEVIERDVLAHVPDTSYRFVRAEVVVAAKRSKLVGRATWATGHKSILMEARRLPIVVDSRGRRVYLLPAVVR